MKLRMLVFAECYLRGHKGRGGVCYFQTD